MWWKISSPNYRLQRQLRNTGDGVVNVGYDIDQTYNYTNMQIFVFIGC